MDEAAFDRASREPGRALRVVIAYNDIAGGRRAMHVLANIAKELGNDIEFQPLPWLFGLLADVDWREVAASDAVSADILIIATSSTNPLPQAVGRWGEAAISQKRGTHAAVVALFAGGEYPAGSGSSQLEAIQMAARQAGLDFFAPAPHLELDVAVERIRQRAEMVTPLLEEILHHHPGPRWEQSAQTP